MSNHDYLDEMYDNHTGVLAGIMPEYERRESQVLLSKAIHDTITNGLVLLGSAPPGSGKSISYLIPAIYNAVFNDEDNKPILIVTANKALQDQLIEKDLPLLEKAFSKRAHQPFDFSYQLVKGRQNYLCHREMDAFNATRQMPGFRLEEIDEAHALSAWASVTQTGDQSDAPPGVSLKVWNAFSVSGERCGRRACPFVEACFAEKVLDRASKVNIVVANYDLFFSKLARSNEPVWQGFGTVIFDEAHDLSNIARRCLGRELSLSHFNQLANDYGQFVTEAKFLKQAASDFFEDISRYALNNNKPRVNEQNFVATIEILDALNTVQLGAAGGCGYCSDDPRCAICMARRQIRDRANSYIAIIKDCTEQTSDVTAYWIDKPNDSDRVTPSTVKLRTMPYRVGDQLSAQVFEAYPAVICVSATMTSGGTFDFIRGELGLVSRAVKPTTGASISTPIAEDREGNKIYTPMTNWQACDYRSDGSYPSNVNLINIQVPSPFDFAKQARFIVPLGIPFPVPEYDHLYREKAADAIKQLINDCKGRTLALFTSWSRLNFVANKLRDNINYPLLVQGDAPNKTLAQMFRDQTDSVLLATKSFWVGLDVQGESLSCLIIDKLPLESFSDPIVDMMKQKHPDTFWGDFYFPRAAIELAQGAGRLIRSVNDRGVFVLLDARIIAKSYGGMMRRSLPFVGLSKNLADAGKFLSSR